MEPIGTIAERLYRGFLAPLVIGGAMRPAKPIGARAAIALGEERVDVDAELASHVALARVRVARQLAPIDRFEPATKAEWMMAAALHDLVQSAHPGLDGAFRRSAPARILDLVDATLSRVPKIADVRDALSRHTFFARLFEITRTDATVSWWTGSTRYLGEEPPARLLAWPELRRVHVDKIPRKLIELPASGSAVAPARFGESLARFLAATPLTDLATLTRAEPVFAWSEAALSLVSTRGGRTLALRALGRLRETDADAALGRATKALLDPKRAAALAIALPLLAERALAAAQAAGVAMPNARSDGSLARVAGALAARALLDAKQIGLTEDDAAHARALLEPLAESATPEIAGAVTRALG